MPTDSSGCCSSSVLTNFPRTELRGAPRPATPLPPCTSSTRRADIGGLPPRVGIPIALEDPAKWQVHGAVEASLRGAVANNAVARRQKIDRIRRALASGAALSAVLGADEPALRQQAEAMDARDPRLEWRLPQAPRWREAKEKTLVFVAHRETLEMLRTALSHRTQLASGVFHEELSPARRDTEVARFRESEGPSLLVSTECGGEGRNFEFCRRLVLFDLPWKPSVVEQRIGRLDRIGRRSPVDIVYFRSPGGIGADVVRLFETLGVFRGPVAGREPQLAHVEDALGEIALDPLASLSGEVSGMVSDARAARTASAKRRIPPSRPYRGRWPRAFSRACQRFDALTGGGRHRKHRSGFTVGDRAARISRSRSVTGIWSTVCLAFLAGRATSSHSMEEAVGTDDRLFDYGQRSLRGSSITSGTHPRPGRSAEIEIGQNQARIGGNIQGRALFDVWRSTTRSGRPGSWLAAFHGLFARES